MSFPRLLPAVLVSLLVVVACGEVPEPEPFALTGSTASTAPDSGASSVEAPSAGGDDPEVTVVAPNFVPQRPADYLPEVLVSTGSELLAAGLGSEAAPLDGLFAGQTSVRAVDDLLGGLVVQRPGVDSDVVWLSGEEALAVATDATLYDVGFAGAAYAVVEIDGALEQIRLVDRERTTLFPLAEEQEVLSLSSSGVLSAIALADTECGAVRFVDVDGNPVTIDAMGEPNCPVPGRPYFSNVALSPDGGALAYTVVTYREDGLEAATDLSVLDIGGSTIYFRRKIGEDGDRITSLTFDGDRVAYLKRTADTQAVTVLQVASGAQERTVSVPAGEAQVSSISFARLPLAEG